MQVYDLLLFMIKLKANGKTIDDLEKNEPIREIREYAECNKIDYDNLKNAIIDYYRHSEFKSYVLKNAKDFISNSDDNKKKHEEKITVYAAQLNVSKEHLMKDAFDYATFNLQDKKENEDLFETDKALSQPKPLFHVF